LLSILGQGIAQVKARPQGFPARPTGLDAARAAGMMGAAERAEPRPIIGRLRPQSHAPEMTPMPLPMVHLTVAVRMLPELGQPEFLLGNLAPDAIHMRPGSTSEDKRRVHLHQSSAPLGGDGREAVGALLDAWGSDGSISPLRLGCVCHLLTDGLWRQRVYARFLTRLPAGLEKERIARVYYRETDEIDRLIHESAPWRPEVWRLLSEALCDDIPGIVAGEEIDLWRERTLRWFETLPPAAAPLEYLSPAEVDAFATETAVELGDWLSARGYGPFPGGRPWPPVAPPRPGTRCEAIGGSPEDAH